MPADPLNLSFEFFPPRSMQGCFDLWAAVQMVAPFDPGFVSVTYGAGGATRALTHDAVDVIANSCGLNVAAHLTCVEASREETLAIAEDYARVGVKQIVALRGDPPGGGRPFAPAEDGCANSLELIELLAGAGQFKIYVGAYPERHPDAADDETDIDWLKRKFDAGADSAITQFFFEPETFLRFRDRCARAGLERKIIPGIMPVRNWARTRGFAERAGIETPTMLDAAFRNARTHDCEELLAVSLAAGLCSDLVDEGVSDFHFYTLNRPHLTRQVCWALGAPERLQLARAA